MIWIDFDPVKHEGKPLYESVSRETEIDGETARVFEVVPAKVSFKVASETPWFYMVEIEETGDVWEESAGPGRGWWGPPIGTHGKGKEGGTASEVASGLLGTARQKEPAITETVTTSASAHGGEMEGLESRLKTEESLTRKLSAQAKENGTTPLAERANIHDAARYTVVFDEAHYSKGVSGVQGDLARAGYKEYDHQFKNYWTPGGAYKGYNCVFEDKSGFRFEVQFHTKQSITTKATSHRIYERARVLPHGPQRTAAIQQMQSLWANVPAPSGWQSLRGVTF